MNNTVFTCSFDEYSGHDAVNHSRLKLIDKSPWHYYHYKPSKPTKEQEFGTKFHELLLETNLFDKKYIVIENRFLSSARTKAGKAERQEFINNNPGKEIINSDDWLTLSSMRESVMTDPYAKQIFSSGQAELTALWDDKKTGISCKGRIDWIPDAIPNVIVDLKTTRDAHPDNLSKACYNFGYYTQAAFYLGGWEAIYGKPAEGFIFCFVEKPSDPEDTPLPPQIYELSPDFIKMGKAKVKGWMNKLSEIKGSKNYDHYTNGLSVLTPPAWASRMM